MILNGIDVMFSSPQRRCRSGILWQLICGTLLLTLMGTGCGASQGYTGERAQDSGMTSSALDAAAAEAPATEQVATVVPNVSEDTKTAKPEAVGPAPTTTPHPIAVADTELPKAPIGFESLFDRAATGPQPISIEIRAIGVNGAAIVPVGVNKDDLSFEVPPADQVGWRHFKAQVLRVNAHRNNHSVAHVDVLDLDQDRSRTGRRCVKKAFEADRRLWELSVSDRYGMPRGLWF